MFSLHGKISGNDLSQNEMKMNTAYNVNLPIEVLFDQVENGMDYTDAVNHLKTPEQIIMTGQKLAQETGMFTDKLKIWKRLLANDRTWTRFKLEFSLAHKELRENTAVGKCTFGQANNAERDVEITEVMENLVTATTSDRSTVITLSTTIKRLTEQLATTNS